MPEKTFLFILVFFVLVDSSLEFVIYSRVTLNTLYLDMPVLLY